MILPSGPVPYTEDKSTPLALATSLANGEAITLSPDEVEVA